jgi:hypothetical protein
MYEFVSTQTLIDLARLGLRYIESEQEKGIVHLGGNPSRDDLDKIEQVLNDKLREHPDCVSGVYYRI